MGLLDLCRRTVTIRRPTNTSDSVGGVVASFSDQFTNVRVSVQAATADEIETWSRRGVQISHRIYLASSLDVRLGDVVIDGSVTYRVTAPPFDMGDRGRAFKILALQVQ